jgi:hypothetical protein
MSQVKDNLKTFRAEWPLTKKEWDVLMDIAESLKQGVPCTSCRYCCAGRKANHAWYNVSVTSQNMYEEMIHMELKAIDHNLSVCKVSEIADIDMSADFFFVAKTDEELSFVCKTEDVPPMTIKRDDGWRCFRIQGILDFSLVGILARLSAILAEHQIGIFAVSTFNTDYILVKEENFRRALEVLSSEGYTVV